MLGLTRGLSFREGVSVVELGVSSSSSSFNLLGCMDSMSNYRSLSLEDHHLFFCTSHSMCFGCAKVSKARGRNFV